LFRPAAQHLTDERGRNLASVFQYSNNAHSTAVKPGT
jgi:hypothetical protein